MTDTSVPDLALAAAEALQAVTASTGPDTDLDVPAAFGVIAGLVELVGHLGKILGNIEVGHCSKVAAGSVVLAAVPHNKTVAGVPARIVGETSCADQPSRLMDQYLPTAIIDNLATYDI